MCFDSIYDTYSALKTSPSFHLSVVYRFKRANGDFQRHRKEQPRNSTLSFTFISGDTQVIPFFLKTTIYEQQFLRHLPLPNQTNQFWVKKTLGAKHLLPCLPFLNQTRDSGAKTSVYEYQPHLQLSLRNQTSQTFLKTPIPIAPTPQASTTLQHAPPFHDPCSYRETRAHDTPLHVNRTTGRHLSE